MRLLQVAYAFSNLNLAVQDLLAGCLNLAPSLGVDVALGYRNTVAFKSVDKVLAAWELALGCLGSDVLDCHVDPGHYAGQAEVGLLAVLGLVLAQAVFCAGKKKN